ncbi:MAG: hypothetical protein HYR91_13580 [Flavobacteriia bacterium]|nr:hypothetical protein [Flavobacteriia bacterium]
MKNFFLLAFVILQNIGLSQQQIDIPAESFPFYDLIEWKGMGSMLLNRDPLFKTLKINLTFVGKQSTNTLMWKESFNPASKESYFISSENARYIYFLDNLQLNNGKFAYSQISSGGTVKSSAADAFYALKKIYPMEQTDLKLIDIVTTDKALIHIYRYHDKKEKKFVDLATSMTHHNLTLYTGIIGESQEETIKNKSTNGWFYVGSTGEQIYFATRDNVKKKNGFTIKEFNTRVESKISTFIPDMEKGFEMIENSGFGTTGKNYLKNENTIEQSILTHHNSKFYLTGVGSEGSSKVLKTYVWNADKWDLLKTAPISIASKQTLILGVMPLNEGLATKIDNGTKAMVITVPFTKTEEVILTDFKPAMLYNPSRFVLSERKEEFVFRLMNKTYFFNSGQLNKVGGVKFDVIEK